MGLVEEALGEVASAAEHLTWALQLKPGMAAAARRLGALLAHGRFNQARLRPEGLLAALDYRTVDRDLVAAAAWYYLADHTSLRKALDVGRTAGWVVAARSLILDRTAPALRDPLLIGALAAGPIGRQDLEKLLAAVRSVVLLELSDERLRDQSLITVVVALVQQMWANEFVWQDTAAERRLVGELRPDFDAWLAGRAEAAPAVLRYLLYRPPVRSLRIAGQQGSLGAIEPQSARQALSARLDADREVDERSSRLGATAMTGSATSALVSGQYETAPYPRWTGIQTHRNGEYLEQLTERFGSRRMAFAARPFEILIAGCGTGKQAVSAAIDYGPHARVLGIDITRKSLAYAEFMAAQMEVDNIRFALGDIDAIDTVMPSFEGRFKVIECCGVLHHMADPFSAWSRLTRCLDKGGIMLIGLYSGVARKGLAALRAEQQFPGPGASDDALRDYRSYLMARPADEPGSEMVRVAGRDFYSTSGFRDCFLHVSEKTTTLQEISEYMAQSGLKFHGFVKQPIESLRKIYPDEAEPGSLLRWAELEQRSPLLFSGMYQFWCTRD